MKPYGVPRVPELDFPDVADIQYFGLKGSIGREAGRSGDISRPYIRSNHKAWIRRIWKRKARAAGKIEILEALKEA